MSQIGHLFVYISHVNTSNRVTLSSGASYPIAFGECQAKMASQDDIYQPSEYFKRYQEHKKDGNLRKMHQKWTVNFFSQ